MDKFHRQGRQTHRRPSWGEAGGGSFFFIYLLILNSTGQLIAASKKYQEVAMAKWRRFPLGSTRSGGGREQMLQCGCSPPVCESRRSNSFTSTALNHNWDQILPEAERPDYRSIWRVKQSIHVSDAAWHGTNRIMFLSHFSHRVSCSQATTSGWPLI